VIDAAIDCHVQKVVALSTDKAVNPVNLYGATKLVSDKLFISANAYAGGGNPVFAVVRYGNVSGSRGSILPYFLSLVQKGETALPITDTRMTRFFITLDEGVALVLRVLKEAKGGETYIARIPSFRVTDLACAVCPHCALLETGIREGEKLHEVMISKEDAPHTREFAGHYVIYPRMDWCDPDKYDTTGGRQVEDGFEYSSGENAHFLSVPELAERVVPKQ
jgi:FlaA1/EpsC-like NDP-sugar epimerase